ncbi:MAG: alpha/beta hydrolase [Clostridia bacterium]|nr:alpha/beta hydrolase [Clostridia bacterium]
MRPTLSTIRTERAETEYAVFGEGSRPFVMIPGVSLRRILKSAPAVESAFRIFSEQYTVYLFDRRNRLPEGLSIPDMAKDLADAMLALDLHQADIYGASQGGMIAQCLAGEHPELVRRAVLASTLSRANPTALSVLDGWISGAKAGDVPSLVRLCLSQIYSSATLEQFGEALFRFYRDISQEELERFLRMSEACLGFDYYEQLPKIQCPVLVVGSRGDTVLTPESSLEIASRLSCCSCFLYGEEYGHMVFDEAPDFKQRMLDFFLAPEAPAPK